jgi:ABC-type phosphate/phosphonate transport system permease subunit
MQFLLSIKKIFTSKLRIFLYIVLAGTLGVIWWVFTDIEIMFGNYGNLHTGFDIFLSLLMIALFPLFLIALWYRGDVLSGTLQIKRTSLIGTAG